MNKKVLIKTSVLFIVICSFFLFVKINAVDEKIDLSKAGKVVISYKTHDKEINNNDDVKRVITYINSITYVRSPWQPKTLGNVRVSVYDKNGNRIKGYGFSNSVIWIGRNTYWSTPVIDSKMVKLYMSLTE